MLMRVNMVIAVSNMLVIPLRPVTSGLILIATKDCVLTERGVSDLSEEDTNRKVLGVGGIP